MGVYVRRGNEAKGKRKGKVYILQISRIKQNRIKLTFHLCEKITVKKFLIIYMLYCVGECFKGHLSWSFYFLYVLGIVNSHIINYILVSISSDLSNKTDI